MTVVVFIRNLVFYTAYNFIWFCDIGLLLFFIAFLTKNDQFIKGLISIGLFAQFVFILEVILYSLFHISLSSLPSDLFRTSQANIVISLIIHLFSTNFALLMTYKKKTTRKSLIYSAGVLILLWIMTIFFTPAVYNINYVFSLSFFFGLTMPFYTLLWPLIAFTALILPTYWFQKGLYTVSTKKARKNFLNKN